MSMPKGNEEYLIENEKVVAFGISHSTQEMEDALKNEVYDKIFDVREHLEIVESLSDTGFDKAIIMERLFPSEDKEDWEIGEAYAQVYAETNLNSNIPWGISRDIKKPKSSLPGADIVGLYQQTDDTFFLFGEIKTSSHSEYPPSVMYGEHGLKKQLEDLCENKDITDKLVEYLAYRLKNGELWPLYSNAFSNYMQSDGKKVHILGVLVRDVEPKEDDLTARTKKLEKFVVDGRSIELVGIYVPIGSIEKFPHIVSEERERRSASNVEKC